MENVRFSVKFKGKVYEDARRSTDGHVWFDKNHYEYCPDSERVLIHDFEPYNGGYRLKLRISVAKVIILDEEEKKAKAARLYCPGSILV